MKPQFTYLLGIMATIILGVVCYINLCAGCFVSEEIVPNNRRESVVKAKPDPTHPFFVANDAFSIEVNDNFLFNSSEPSFLMPISEDLKKGIISLKEHLDVSPDKLVLIIGFYSTEETNNSNFEDLGVARANSVKNHLVMHGVSSNQIQTESKPAEQMVSVDNVLYGPITIQVLRNAPAENESQPQ